MVHHVKIYIDGPLGNIGYARVTIDGEILSIWIQDQEMLFIPEMPYEGEDE